MPSGSSLGIPPWAADLAPVAARTFAAIAQQWDLSEAEQTAILGGRDPHASTLVSLDEIARVSLVIGIYKDINALLPLRDRANAWMRAENGAFGGGSAIEVILADGLSGLLSVRRYLAAEAN